MQCRELIGLFEQGKRRWHLIGSQDYGVIAGLDMEGRLYAIMNGRVMNRVNPLAFSQDCPEGYANPGGDGLWPAPEGTTLGYEYPTGKWRVPPGLAGAKYQVVNHMINKATICAEVDLINNAGLGIPTQFGRTISIESSLSQLVMRVEEKIVYLGHKELSRKDCLLAPWTLSQFDCGPGCQVIFPSAESSQIWDLYDPSASQRLKDEGICYTRTDGSQRYQIGLGQDVPWIEFQNPSGHLRVRRTAEPVSLGQAYIDIADAPPTQPPQNRDTRFSVYSDTAGFMEIEAVGGCLEKLTQGAVLALKVQTEYSLYNGI